MHQHHHDHAPSERPADCPACNHGTEQKSPMWLIHVICGHVWIGAYLPMDTSILSELRRTAACPKCFSRVGVQLASKADIETVPAVRLLAAAKALEVRGWFREHSCADADTKKEMAAMRDAIEAAED